MVWNELSRFASFCPFTPACQKTKHEGTCGSYEVTEDWNPYILKSNPILTKSGSERRKVSGCFLAMIMCP